MFSGIKKRLIVHATTTNNAPLIPSSTLLFPLQPMGVMALLDEECLFPKGSDKSYLEKLNKTHADKSPNFLKAERSRAQMAEFEIVHYAGTVRPLAF